MTVAVNDTIERYVIAGAGPYPYTWRIFNDTDLQVYALSTASPPVPTLLTYLTHYTVSGANDAAGGSVTLLTSAFTPYAGYTLDIRANTPENQPTSIRNQARFLPEIHEDAFDYLSRQIQDLRRLVNEKIGAPDNEPPLDLTIPPVATRAGKYGAYDALGQPIASAGTGNDSALRTDLAQSSGSTLIGWIQAGVGAVIRTIQDLFRERISVKDFGAVGDGVALDQAAITAAITYAGSLSFRGIVRFPKGIYRITGITIPTQGVSLEGEGRRESVLTYPAGAGDAVLVTGQNVRIKKLQVLGNASALSLIRYSAAPQGYMSDVHGSMNGSPNDGFIIEKSSFYHIAWDCMVDGANGGGVTTGARAWTYQQNGGSSGPNSSANLFGRVVNCVRGFSLTEGNDMLFMCCRIETDITIGVDVGPNMRDVDILKPRFDWNKAASIGVNVQAGALRTFIKNPRNDIAGAGSALLTDAAPNTSGTLMQEGNIFSGRVTYKGGFFLLDTVTNNPFIDMGTGAGPQKLLVQISGAIADYFAATGFSWRVRVNGGTTVMQADTAGNVQAGIGALTTTATDGFLYISSGAGAPTGVPTAKAGFVPLYVDTTNNKLYFRSGGAWRDAGP